MKRSVSIAAVLALAAFCSAQAQSGKGDTAKDSSKEPVKIQLAGKPADGPIGIGLFLGEPSGIDVGWDISDTSWLDAKAAWSFFGGNSGFRITLQGNYEYAFPGLLVIETLSFTPFCGAGAFASIYDGGASFGARALGGVSYRFTDAPFELFLEAGLDVALLPGFGLGGSGGLGVRYRF